MAHWLEEAERMEHPDRPRLLQKCATVQETLHMINKNYEAHKTEYECFTVMLYSLCVRANQLPAERRRPWNHFDVRAKESKPDNHLCSFTSCERFDKVASSSSFPFVKWQHYKHVREMLFSVSREMGTFEIAVRDNYFAKINMQSKKGHYSSKHSDHGPMSTSFIFPVNIRNLNRETALKILDWLAFKAEVTSLPFYESYDKAGSRLHAGWLASVFNWRTPKSQRLKVA